MIVATRRLEITQGVWSSSKEKSLKDPINHDTASTGQFMFYHVQHIYTYSHVTLSNLRANRSCPNMKSHVSLIAKLLQATFTDILLNLCGRFTSKVPESRPHHIFLSGHFPGAITTVPDSVKFWQ